ncbi:hypothetical protein CDD82_2650 [Ophiocordyceps australis]|uniref:Uncharacterized protein n=1 Tax=Ophiocordyceps australis TaxID=1399860 RepID=A0A2C5Z099_9HYPO|nr:hypothetical protein CDD82_2650 [Ophiocordyceps australis]
MMKPSDIRQDAFPAPSRHAHGLVDGVDTQATYMGFADKMLVTISQEGRLSQWFHVALAGNAANVLHMALPSASNSLLPATHLTPRTLLGAGGDDRETLGQLYAAQIASFICLKSPDESRSLLLGLGLCKPDTHREAFFDLLDLARQVL